MGETGLDPIRVLIVDDELAVRNFFARVLASTPPAHEMGATLESLREKLFGAPEAPGIASSVEFSHTVCSQGDEAIEAVRQAMEAGRPFAMAFVDVRMPPGPDGIVTAEAIRQMDPDVNIVIVTGYSDIDVQTIAERVPPLDKLLYVEKPLRSQEVRQMALALGARWRAERLLLEACATLETCVQQRTKDLAKANENLKQRVEALTRTEAALRDSEDKLKRSQKDLRRILDSMPFGVIVIGKDKRVRQVNQMALRMTKCASPEEIVGRFCQDFLCTAAVCPVWELGQEVDGSERVLVDSEGNHIPVLKSVLRVGLEDEEVLLETFLDISAQKRAEEERTRLITAIEQAGEAVVVADADGGILYANPAFERITGYLRQDVLGRDAATLGLATPRADDMAELLAAIRSGLSWQGTLEGRRPDGAIYHVEATFSPVRDPDGKVNNYVAVCRDITKEMELSNRLRQAQKMEAIGTLAGGIAHDFNNILSGMMGFAELAIGDLPEQGMAADSVREILQSGRRASELIHQILAFSRQTEQERKPVRLQSILREALALLRRSLPATIDIQEEIDSNCGYVLADSTQMHQVIMNLCTNAFHAMQKTGGVLHVSLREVESPSMVELTVRDTGHGIDSTVLPRIFEPYFTTKAAGQGTGLGLATVHGIVESHQGEISVETELGRGTAFHIRLPVREAPKEVVEVPVLEGEIERGSARVLFVDDEESLTKLGKARLERLGYTVRATTDSLEALALFQADPASFDVVITDQTMPNMTGLELAREIMVIRADIPVILSTGFSDMATAQASLAIGIRECVRKPCLTRDLVGAIQRALKAKG